MECGGVKFMSWIQDGDFADFRGVSNPLWSVSSLVMLMPAEYSKRALIGLFDYVSGKLQSETHTEQVQQIESSGDTPVVAVSLVTLLDVISQYLVYGEHVSSEDLTIREAVSNIDSELEAILKNRGDEGRENNE